ncbi:hypothetical protein NXS19_008493 [Fusarium pseudograminearum]|nr:hypothetical protein FPSE5266_20095 [Fusarium pseudograminearum]UZP40677.1 hypothetical protein NXS19_008493 [Fusarium pseudograminearum]
MPSSNEQPPTTTQNVALTEEQIELALTEARHDVAEKKRQLSKARRKVANLRRRLEERRAANSTASDPLLRGIMGVCQDPETLVRHAEELIAQPGVKGVTFHVVPLKNETEAETRV